MVVPCWRAGNRSHKAEGYSAEKNIMWNNIKFAWEWTCAEATRCQPTNRQKPYLSYFQIGCWGNVLEASSELVWKVNLHSSLVGTVGILVWLPILDTMGIVNKVDTEDLVGMVGIVENNFFTLFSWNHFNFFQFQLCHNINFHSWPYSRFSESWCEPVCFALSWCGDHLQCEGRQRLGEPSQ